MWTESVLSLIIRAFFLLQLIHGTYSCPPDQIYQEVTRSCCYPVFNCRPGTGVVFCTKNGTNDTCTPCQGGKIQPQLVSSLDGIDAMCFSDENQYDCTSDELIPAREERPPCGLTCLCNYDNCYYGYDPCRCKIKDSQSCGVDMTMDKTTGECVKCPKYTFKNNTGCGLCYYNETEWFNYHKNEISTMFTPLTSIGVIDEIEYNRSKQVETLSGVDIPVAAVIVISVLVGFGVVLILVCIFRQRLKKKWLYMCNKCQNRSAEEDPESQTPVMEVRPVVQYCNDAQHEQNHDLISVGCDRPAVILPVAEPTLDDRLCQRNESEQDQTYLKEVVNSQTDNEQEGFHSGTFEISMLSPGEAGNEYCIRENAHGLQEEPATQREEEENEDEEVVPFIAQ